MINTINGWTKESIINHLKANFKGKSVDSTGFCSYRGSLGTKCAIGMFIPDSMYVSEMDEGNNGYRRTDTEYPRLRDVVPLEVSAMAALQGIHDGSDPTNTLNAMINWVNNTVA